MINRESFFWSVKPIYTIYQICKYLIFPLRIVVTDFRDRKDRQSTIIALPPAKLRHRVHGNLNKVHYLKVGENIAKNIIDLCASVDRDIYSFGHILDFGCGTGRVIRNFHDAPESCHLYGTDIDEDIINWCKEYPATNIQWSLNGHQPPLSFPDNTFDLIYAISVFTHLNEEFQHLWLSELQRIAKSGAIIILTVHGGPNIINKLSSSQQRKMHSHGFLFLTGVTGKFRLNKLPVCLSYKRIHLSGMVRLFRRSSLCRARN